MADNSSEYTASRTKANYKDVFYQGAALIFIRLDDVFPFPDDIVEISRSLEAYHLRESFQFTLDFLESSGMIRRFRQDVRRDASDVDVSRYDLMFSLNAITYRALQQKSTDLTMGSGNETIVMLLKKALREKEVDVRRQIIKKLIDNLFNACIK